MINNLAERVDDSLRKQGDSLWLPELTIELVEVGWRDLYRTAGLLPDTYGTARVIAREVSAPRRIIARMPLNSSTERPKRELQVEILDSALISRYEQAGVKFYPARDIETSNVLQQLKKAITVLNYVPSLSTTIAALIRTIHLLIPDGDDYDVSFSEPHVPFSIFASIPLRGSVISPLRVAEAIVHEAMHLQLTLLERVVPLVAESRLKYLSPWRGEFRASGGVLHALYVFRVIDAFLLKLLACPLMVESRLDYISDRREQIAIQMNEIRSFRECPDLTPFGVSFVNHLLN